MMLFGWNMQRERTVTNLRRTALKCWTQDLQLRHIEKRFQRLRRFMPDEYSIAAQGIWRKYHIYLYDSKEQLDRFLDTLTSIIRAPQKGTSVIIILHSLIKHTIRVHNEFLLNSNPDVRKKSTKKYDIIIPKLESLFIDKLCECARKAEKLLAQNVHLSSQATKACTQLNNLCQNYNKNKQDSFVDMLKQRKAMQSLLKKLRELTRSLLAPEDRIVVPKKEEIIAEFCSNPTNKEQFGEELPATDDIASAWSRREKEPVSSLTYKEWRAALAVFSSHHIDTDPVKEQ